MDLPLFAAASLSTHQIFPMLRTFAILAASLFVTPGVLAYSPVAGDIVFHTSTSAQSAAVQAATHSKYSHMGIVLFRGGRPFVLEAVQPVKYTALESWLNRGAGQHYVVKRLKSPLTSSALSKLDLESLQYLGKPYDLTFEWSDEKIYCSELVWKLYKSALGIELAPLAKLGSFDLEFPAVKAKLKQRFPNGVPLDEPVIAPSAIFESVLLVTVAKR
ncbi:MAG: YiiX family permuted papain-like enzyme [Dokdonella sp.]